MSDEQSTGELMVFGLMEQADRLAKSAKASQESLGEQIEELEDIEDRITAAVATVQAAVKNLEAERARLAAVSPTLQQNAVWAVREAIREQGGHIGIEIRREVRETLAEPLQDIHAGAKHVRQNVRETKWFFAAAYVLLGLTIGALVSYWPLHSSLAHLEVEVSNMQARLAAQQQPPPMTLATPGPGHKGRK